MDWTYLKKILRIFFGVLLFAAGIVLLVVNFTAVFEISFAFLSFLVLVGGFCMALFGIHSLGKPE